MSATNEPVQQAATESSATPSSWTQRLAKKIEPSLLSSDAVAGSGSEPQPKSDPVVKQRRGRKPAVDTWTPERAEAAKKKGGSFSGVVIEFYDDVCQAKMEKVCSPLLPAHRQKFIQSIALDDKTKSLFAECGGEVAEQLQVDPKWFPVATMAGIMARHQMMVSKSIKEVQAMIISLHKQGQLPGQQPKPDTSPANVSQAKVVNMPPASSMPSTNSVYTDNPR